MPGFWQSVKTPASSRRKQKADANNTFALNPSENSLAADKPTNSSSQNLVSLPPESPRHKSVAMSTFPIILPDHHDAQPSFRPGRNFDYKEGKGDHSGGKCPVRNQRGELYPRLRPQISAESQSTVHEGQKRLGPARIGPPLVETQRQSVSSRRPLRTVASSPNLFTRKPGKTSLLAPPRHHAFRASSASHDCRTPSDLAYEPLPFPPFDKPLPPIPTFRQRHSPDIHALGAEAPPKQRFDNARSPPSYVEAESSASPNLAAISGDPLSTRTKIVMEVLSHMVALLKTRDEASLMEFSHLVSSQTRDLHANTSQEVLAGVML